MPSLDAIEGLVIVCTGKKCDKRGGSVIAKAIKRGLKERGLKKAVPVVRCACTGHCKAAPVVSVQPGNAWSGGRDASATVDWAMKHTTAGPEGRTD